MGIFEKLFGKKPVPPPRPSAPHAPPTAPATASPIRARPLPPPPGPVPPAPPPAEGVDVAPGVLERFGPHREKRLRKMAAELGLYSITLVEHGPFVWADASQVFGYTTLTRRWIPRGADEIDSLEGPFDLELLLEDARPELASCTHHLLQVVSILGATVYDDPAQVEHAFNPDGQRHFAPPRLREEWQPPHFDGARFAFFALWATPGEPRGEVIRVTVDGDTLQVTIERLGPGPSWPDPLDDGDDVIEGRAYAGTDGGLVSASLSGAGDTRSSVAARWRERARMEHASIASFARASMELMAAGAPLDLVARMHEAALDEIRHAEQCLAVAEHLDGQPADFGPLPALAPRPGTREDIAQRTLVEAALPETEAAARAHREADDETDPFVREVLRAQAVDEERHAALAWEIVGWASPSLAARASPAASST